ncbi:hypothetical protein [Frankia sp. CiP1_Cm_nod1]|uniref:hypothetical protein n=1 Tax=Frankia sp. CiP1_Cm_nod1 TaxID=2897160 RepID=UPI0020254130
MSTAAGRLAALAGIPLVSRHVQGTFGPATLRLAGARAVLDLDDGGSPPLRLTWTDEPCQATDTPGRTTGRPGRTTVGRQLADLLRTRGTAVFARPDLLRLARRRKITDLPITAPAAPRSVQATTVRDGVRLEITSWPDPAAGTRVPRNTAPDSHDRGLRPAGTRVPRNTAPDDQASEPQQAGARVPRNTAPTASTVPGAGHETEHGPRTAPTVPAPTVPGGAPAAPLSAAGTSTAHDPDRDARDAHTTGFGAWAGTRAVVLSTAQARDLADLLEAWAALPPG